MQLKDVDGEIKVVKTLDKAASSEIRLSGPVTSGRKRKGNVDNSNMAKVGQYENTNSNKQLKVTTTKRAK